MSPDVGESLEQGSHGGAVRIEGARVRLGRTLVLDGVSLDLAAGECVALLGSSGSGKTTIPRLLAGFVEPERGTVWLDGRDITRQPPERRGMAMIHQRFLLFPHLTAAENVAFGLPYRGVRRAEQAAITSDLLKLVGLEGFEARYPQQLSGGQQQRVAIARALATQPRVLLLDEPLNSLDAPIRERLLDELRALHASSGMTMLYVTHDQAEAARVADRVALLDGGRILQIDAYEALRDRPASPAVARVLGLRNLLPAEYRDGQVTVPTLDLVLPSSGAAPAGPLLAYLPPDRLTLGPTRADWLAFDAVVDEIVPLPHAVVPRPRRGEGPRAGHLEVISTRAQLDEHDVAVGSRVRIGLPPRALHLLSAEDAPPSST